MSDRLDLRRVLRWLAGAAAVTTTVLAGITYVGARTLTNAPGGRRRSQGYDLVARFSGRSEGVSFVHGPDADRPGRWGLVHPDGYAQLGDTLRRTLRRDGTMEIVRPFTVLDGMVPADVERRSAGRRTGARMDERRRSAHDAAQPVPGRWCDLAFPDDPQLLADRHGARFELDCVTSPNGACLPAWRLLPVGTTAGATWMVAVHGRGAPRTEVFRLVDIALGRGIPCMVVSYRTDPWTHAPAELTRLGGEEWEDVAAAMRQLVRDGAGRIVLAGCSLGGAICAQVVRRSAMAPYVVGVVLDAPALSWAPILAHVARGRRLPPVLVAPVMAAARWRARLDWQSLDLLASADDFWTPILLLHGTADEAVPCGCRTSSPPPGPTSSPTSGSRTPDTSRGGTRGTGSTSRLSSDSSPPVPDPDDPSQGLCAASRPRKCLHPSR